MNAMDKRKAARMARKNRWKAEFREERLREIAVLIYHRMLRIARDHGLPESEKHRQINRLAARYRRVDSREYDA
jgi:hypothetical protein